MNDYVSIFEGKINSIHHHENGSVLQALYTLKGQEIMCIDSIVQHVFFTPAISFLLLVTPLKNY
ncbi:VOC family protein [Metabacillus hrfriensis]|uniref:VOC family protein n=1 Tax=Metabacillus hrfriensis TaxID=3048891 RepID=A0ACD4R6Z6_9BACI|nr:VOC family protein [Metabacillus sp. CT-WN-B3]WHZ56250.1 VOC family protein [Metabacillus sp. CT-WN-B3]